MTNNVTSQKETRKGKILFISCSFFNSGDEILQGSSPPVFLTFATHAALVLLALEDLFGTWEER